MKSDLVKDLVNKFEVNRDALHTFKNQSFWQTKIEKMKKGLE